MTLHYESLDEHTRQFMLNEVDYDISQGTLYISPRLNEQGVQNYPSLLKEAIQSNSDEWLAQELRHRGYLNSHEHRKSKSGFTIAKIPVTAPDTLVEGEFNRFYIRGVCERAIQEGITEVEVYRGKLVTHPRPESEAIIGKRIQVEALLEDLRQSPGKEPVLGFPQPNSGLTVRLP